MLLVQSQTPEKCNELYELEQLHILSGLHACQLYVPKCEIMTTLVFKVKGMKKLDYLLSRAAKAWQWRQSQPLSIGDLNTARAVKHLPVFIQWYIKIIIIKKKKIEKHPAENSRLLLNPGDHTYSKTNTNIVRLINLRKYIVHCLWFSHTWGIM